tara:strand:+ start:496 stop:714 length:219 start_codon:yes stop_codon:yes gene_type:complete
MMNDEDLIRVKGEQHLYRDRETGAILNTDSSGYNQYIKMRKRRQTQKEELDTLKKDIEEIKSLLKEITNGPK